MKQRGYITLMTVIIVGVIVTTTATFLLLTGTGTTKYSQGVNGGQQAKAAAEACVDLALLAIQNDTNISTPAGGNATIDTASGTSCSYAITGTSPNLTINATGTVDQTSDFIRKVKVTVSQVTPQVTVSSRQDVP